MSQSILNPVSDLGFQHRPLLGPLVRWSICGVGLVLLLGAAACESDGERRRAKSVEPIVRDVPSAIRGTIGAESSINGVEPVLVSGLGLVVDLAGTGGGPYPTAIQSTMEREIARKGLGRSTQGDGHAFAGLTPKQILENKNVAVVVVEGVVPPGAPMNGVFDVRVSKLPGSVATSLEGGTLWTTELRFGPVSTFGSAQARQIGEARGPIFINPFAEPGTGAEVPESDGIVRTAGRILGGGRVTEPLALELVLDNASHARASAVQGAINSRFPIEAGQRDQTARGRGPSSVAITIPPSYSQKTGEFVRLVQGLRTDQMFAEEYARRASEELEKNPALAEQLGWILQALNKPALPFVRPLYQSAELVPRMTALRVGARLEDPQAAAPLRQIAQDASLPIPLRAEAAELLGPTPTDPNTDLALRDLVGSEELEIRIAAYTAMLERNDPSITRVRIIDKFDLHIVPSSSPLVYVTQTGKPRIVLFGRNAQLTRPSLAGVWSDRLLVVAEEGEEPVRLMFRNPRGGSALTATTSTKVSDLIKLLAHKVSPENPETGFNLSYSQVVGAVYQMQLSGVIAAPFAVERDRLVDRLSEAQAQTIGDERPENAEVAKNQQKTRARLVSAGGQVATKKEPSAEPASMVVPLPPKGK
ncbi:MAG: flagellar basal body P-ring protein FlgI [bacterium]